MAGAKYLSVVSGIDTMVASNNTTAGAADANKIVALDASGLINVGMMPVGVGPNVKTLISSENLAVGAWVNIYSNVGVMTVRNADASNGRECMGFVLAATTSPAVATVYLSGINNQLSALTLGSRYYLGTVGAGTTTPNSTTGQLSQYLGDALSLTEIEFANADYVVM
jgi:hypothetical protein